MKSVQAIIDQAIGNEQKTLSEYDSKLILAAYGIPITKEFLVTSIAEAVAKAEKIRYPVVLKVCAAEAVHKTEQGLIELGISETGELKKAFSRLSLKAKAFGGRVLVQEMVKATGSLPSDLHAMLSWVPV